MKKNSSLILLTILIFILLFTAGLGLSLRKRLWNDELYSQTQTVEKLTYQDIFLNRISSVNPLEANVCPMFFLVQRIFCDLCRYTLDLDWAEEWSVGDPSGQIVLRLNPNLFMSLSLSLIFYFFARYYSFGLAFYSLFLSLSSISVLTFWVEAKPYAIWFFGTTLQIVLLLMAFQKKTLSRSLYVSLVLTHLFLASTTVLSLLTIVVISFVLLIFLERRWRRYLGLTVLPIGLCFFYYSQARHYTFMMNVSPLHFLALVFYPGRLGLFLTAAVTGILCFFRRRVKLKRPQGECGEDGSALKLYTGYIFVTGLMLLSYFALFFYLRWNGKDGQFFSTYRFFLYLTPMSIVATTFFTAKLMSLSKKNRWLYINFIIGLSGALVLDALIFTRELLGSLIF